MEVGSGRPATGLFPAAVFIRILPLEMEISRNKAGTHILVAAVFEWLCSLKMKGSDVTRRD